MAHLANDIQSEDGVANAAIAEAAQRLKELSALILEVWPLVRAEHGAKHLLDGFRRRSREIDPLYERYLAEVTEC